MGHFNHKEDFRLHVSMGKARAARYIHKFGAVPAMGQNQSGSVWDVNDTPYPWSAFDTPGVIQTEIVDAADNGSVVEVEGLDENFDVIKEQFVLSDSSVTVGTVTFARVYRAYIVSGPANTGAIDITKGGTVIARITETKAQTLMAILTIPAGHSGYLYKGIATAESGADATCNMRARYTGLGQTAFRTGHTFEVNGSGGEYQYEPSFPFRFPEKTDIDVEIITRTNNGRYTAAYDILIIDES